MPANANAAHLSHGSVKRQGPGLKLPPLPPHNSYPTQYQHYGHNQHHHQTQSSAYSQGAAPSQWQLNAQMQLQLHQKEIIAQATRRGGVPQRGPVSPRLCPLGSPGPVTPLTLEEREGYFSATAPIVGGR